MGWTKEDTAQLARPTSMQPDPFTWDLRTRAAAHIEAMEARVAELDALHSHKCRVIESLHQGQAALLAKLKALDLSAATNDYSHRLLDADDLSEIIGPIGGTPGGIVALAHAPNELARLRAVCGEVAAKLRRMVEPHTDTGRSYLVFTEDLHESTLDILATRLDKEAKGAANG